MKKNYNEDTEILIRNFADLFFIVKFIVDFAKLFVGDVGVDLGCSYRGVSEHCLNGADVGAVAQEVGGIGMS